MSQDKVKDEEYLHNEVKVLIGLAPEGMSTDDVIKALALDCWQTRVSMYPIMLTHPRTGVTKTVSEFAEDVVGDSRLAIETNTDLIFISRLFSDMEDHSTAIFLPSALLDKETGKVTRSETLDRIMRGKRGVQ